MRQYLYFCTSTCVSICTLVLENPDLYLYLVLENPDLGVGVLRVEAVQAVHSVSGKLGTNIVVVN
jgi:hypothetical protein